jgi:hypothetical protein
MNLLAWETGRAPQLEPQSFRQPDAHRNREITADMVGIAMEELSVPIGQADVFLAEQIAGMIALADSTPPM